MAPPLFVAIAGPLISPIKDILILIHNEIEKLKKVKSESEFMEATLKKLLADLDEVVTKWRGAPLNETQRLKIEELRELARGMEDCIEHYAYTKRARVEEFEGLLTLGPKIYELHQFAKDMKELNDSLATKAKLLESGGPADPAAPPPRPHRPRRHGMATSEKKLLELLYEVHPQPQPQPQPMRVICIVGFGGSGKTTLAKALWDQRPAEAFPLLAWVERGDYQDHIGLLKSIIGKFWQNQPGPVPLEPKGDDLKLYIQTHLGEQRFLIVLEDMDKVNHLQWIISTFEAMSGRIIVTTNMQGIVNHCKKNPDCYVHQMRALGDQSSKNVSSLRGDEHSKRLVKRCGGLPLALVSVADYLTTKWGQNPTSDNFGNMCNKLGPFLHDGGGGQDFENIRSVLMDAYCVHLSDRTARSCMLYLGLFPNDDCLVKKKKLTRRWVAEGYFSKEETAEENFKVLADGNIIQPVGTRNTTEVPKTCRTLSIVHEFALHKSRSENFIMTINGQQDQESSARNKKVRHIFVNGGNVPSSSKVDLSVRSLTVHGSGNLVVVTRNWLGQRTRSSKLEKYKLMRVLDLEECDDMDDSHLTDICKRWNLRYLSLGPNISMVPKEIAKMRLLEDLHLNKNRAAELPVEVILMPKLIHLTGKFKILCDKIFNSVVLSKSNLQTLSGFIADGANTGFLVHMGNKNTMKELRKVKIWCESVKHEDNLHFQLMQAIDSYTSCEEEIQDGNEFPEKSLTIDFHGLPGGSERVLKNLHDSKKRAQEMKYILRSLKLKDTLFAVPKVQSGQVVPLNKPQLQSNQVVPLNKPQLQSGQVVQLNEFLIVRKLCLSLTCLTQHILAALRGLDQLLELKLIAKMIQTPIPLLGKFQKLRSLCLKFQGSHDPIIQIQVEDGALPELLSLQLLCEHLAGPSVTQMDQIELFSKLQEIELHPQLGEKEREKWEQAAWKHPKRPIVLPFVPVVDPEDVVATQNEQAKQQELVTVEFELVAKQNQSAQKPIDAPKEANPVTGSQEQQMQTVQPRVKPRLNRLTGSINTVSPVKEASRQSPEQMDQSRAIGHNHDD